MGVFGGYDFVRQSALLFGLSLSQGRHVQEYTAAGIKRTAVDAHAH